MVPVTPHSSRASWLWRDGARGATFATERASFEKDARDVRVRTTNPRLEPIHCGAQLGHGEVVPEFELEIEQDLFGAEMHGHRLSHAPHVPVFAQEPPHVVHERAACTLTDEQAAAFVGKDARND